MALVGEAVVGRLARGPEEVLRERPARLRAEGPVRGLEPVVDHGDRHAAPGSVAVGLGQAHAPRDPGGAGPVSRGCDGRRRGHLPPGGVGDAVRGVHLPGARAEGLALDDQLRLGVRDVGQGTQGLGHLEDAFLLTRGHLEEEGPRREAQWGPALALAAEAEAPLEFGDAVGVGLAEAHEEVAGVDLVDAGVGALHDAAREDERGVGGGPERVEEARPHALRMLVPHPEDRDAGLRVVVDLPEEPGLQQAVPERGGVEEAVGQAAGAALARAAATPADADEEEVAGVAEVWRHGRGCRTVLIWELHPLKAI